MVLRFLLLFLLSSNCVLGFYPHFRKQILEKKMWIVDSAMHELLQRKIILAEELGNITNNESLYDYQSERRTIGRLQEKGKENEKTLVASIWTLINNFTRRQSTLKS